MGRTVYSAVLLLLPVAAAYITPLSPVTGRLGRAAGASPASSLFSGAATARRQGAASHGLGGVQMQMEKGGRQRALVDEDAAMGRRFLVSGAMALAAAMGLPNTASAGYTSPPTKLRGAMMSGETIAASVGGAQRWGDFAPRLANLCNELGFAQGDTLPSRAFCSDENQMYPAIQITKHFATPPFDHGRVGGVVATDRHGPHAAHGKDLVLVAASHVGYDAGNWGKYRRLVTEDDHVSTSCGMISAILGWYLAQYEDAQNRIRLVMNGDGDARVRIPTDLLDPNRPEGMYLVLSRMTKTGPNGLPVPIGRSAAYQEYEMLPALADRIKKAPKNDVNDKINKGMYDEAESAPIGGYLSSEMFGFRRETVDRGEPNYFLERHVLANIQEILTSAAPMLTAALAISQLEFERTARTLIASPAYKGKKVFFCAGVNVDISPAEGSKDLLDDLLGDTMFLPVSSLYIDEKGKAYSMQAMAFAKALSRQSTQNAAAVDLEEAMRLTGAAKPTKLQVGASCGCPACTCT
uniref:Limiting CO2-inducible protein B/C beta carbonyic anhydrase domain-containing protein n=1 Tax=Hemiselmis andersenii TaxID=464988 RepID=A0A6U2JA86_HEMAN